MPSRATGSGRLLQDHDRASDTPYRCYEGEPRTGTSPSLSKAPEAPRVRDGTAGRALCRSARAAGGLSRFRSERSRIEYGALEVVSDGWRRWGGADRSGQRGQWFEARRAVGRVRRPLLATASRRGARAARSNRRPVARRSSAGGGEADQRGREEYASALFKKAVLLSDLDRDEDAATTFESVIARFDADETRVIRDIVLASREFLHELAESD
jgi:hypothetical protein